MFEEIVCKFITAHSCRISHMLILASGACNSRFNAWSTTRHSPKKHVKVDEGLGQDALDRFNKDTEEFDDVHDQQIDAEAVGLEQDEKQQDDSHVMDKILNFILQTPACKWLVDILKKETTLKRASPDLMEQIGARIRGVLLSYGDEVSRKTSSQEYEATFELLWSLLRYLKGLAVL
jgi:hypothetical protein